MTGSWNALRAQYVRQTKRLSFFQRYRRLRAEHAALEPFANPQHLLEYLRGSGGTPAAKNRVLQALLACQKKDREPAGTLLTLALWPGLDREYRKLCTGFAGDAELVAAELIGAFTETMMKDDPTTVTRVAATLVMNAKRDATGALKEHKHFVSCLDPEIVARIEVTQDPRNPEERVAENGEDYMVRTSEAKWLKSRLEQDLGEDATLIWDVAVTGLSQREAAERRGRPYDGVRKRYQRTVKRIQQQRPDYLAPRVPLRAPDWHLSRNSTGSAGANGDSANDRARGPARTAAGAVSAVGTPRDPADRRRVPDRTRGRDNRRRRARRGVPPDT